MTCPFCDSNDVEMVAPWGGQIITRQMRCRACNTYFEAIREEFDGAPDQFDHVQEQFDRVQDVSEAASSWTTSSADDR
jgi:transcriptional regulator NrdR family protein